jgi:hypothetical protein
LVLPAASTRWKSWAPPVTSIYGAFQAALVVDARRARIGEVTVVGRVDALAVFDARYQFRDHEVQVHVALSVGMADHIDRYAADSWWQIAAVIEIEAAQEVLIGFAVAECWVTIMPGTASINSAARSKGRVASCFAVMAPSVAESAVPTRPTLAPVTTISWMTGTPVA